MPRTKQNHPKNLKDKIEEAQKELKDPKGCQKGVTENSRRSADSIKGLKRKKVVAETQLKKIPKSPVKKPSQARTAAVKEATPSCSFASSPSQNQPVVPVQNGEPDDGAQSLPGPPEGQPVRAKATPTAASRERPMQTERCSVQQQSFEPCDEERGPAHGSEGSLKDSWGGSANSDNTNTSHSPAPLEVLLKAMEPDLCSLAERKSSFSPTHRRTAGPTVTAQANMAMSAVNVGIPAQLTLTVASKQQQYYQHVSQPVPLSGLAPGQAPPVQYPSSQAYPPGRMQELVQTGPRQGEKQGLHQSYSAMPTCTMTTPVPSGPKVLPQSQPTVQTCQSVSASVPSAIQVPVTPGFHPVQMATIVSSGLEQMCSSSAKDQKSKKPGKYVCEYCSRHCAKPSVLLKHIRSHTGERPYPCVTCGFSFKTKSNLYKHKKSHAHAIKLGLGARSDSGGGTLSQESDRTPSAHSDAEESGESEDESAADLDPESSQSSIAGLSESSMHSASTAHASQGEAEPPTALETLKARDFQKALEPKVTAPLPKVVVYSVNASPLRADSPRVTDSTPELAQAQRQREPQAPRSSVTVLSSLTEVECPSPLQDTISEDEDRHCKSPPSGGHAMLQRQEATDFSQLQRQQATDIYQQQQGKGLLSPRSLGSTDSGYFSRSESADQAMSPPSPFVKITPPTDMDVSKNPLISHSAVVATVMQATYFEKPPALQGQMRPPLETKTLSLEERISKLISDNEAVVDDKQLDSVKPRRTSLSRRGSIDSPKSYIFKDSFQFDLKPIGRRSSSSSDIPKSPFTPTDKSKQVFLLSVPPQYPSMDCLPITRSNSMPTTPGFSALPPNVAAQPRVLRGCQSFDEKIGSLNDDVFISAPPTPNPAVHTRTLVRQIAIEDSSTGEGNGLASTRSMDEGRLGPSLSTELMQKSKSFEHAPEINKRPQQNKGTMFECETCRNRYRKRENFENHKKFYCSELHGPKNKPVAAREVDQDVFSCGIQQPHAFSQRTIAEQQTSIRKRRKMKSVGDDDDQSPTETNPPCSGSFDSCQLSKDIRARTFPQASLIVDLPPNSSLPQIPPIQLMGRSTDSESRLSPIREAQISITTKERGDLQRQGSGTSVIRHTNSFSRPSSFETSESIDRSSPVDFVEKEGQSITKTATTTTVNIAKESHTELAPLPKCKDRDMPGKDHHTNRTTAMPGEICTPTQQSRLVRQNNIQVPEILVTEEPDREQESQGIESEKPPETFSWPQRSESLSKLPTEKLPPKKKRIRLAEMEHSSGESSFESTLSRSLSRDSSLSRCSSVSASFERDELPRADSPSRAECTSRSPEVQNLALACNTLGVPGLRDSREMRRASSEQISCTQPSVEIASEYRSKSFDCGTVSPSRSISPMETTLQRSPPAVSVAQVPLIERRRGPLVRQMSLKIGFENQLQPGKPPVALQKINTANTVLAQQRFHTTGLPCIGQPLILHPLTSGEAPQQKNEVTVQSINLGSQTQQAPVHGLPHPWHQSSKTSICQRTPQAPGQSVVGQQDAQNTSADSQDKRSLVPKYQLQCSAPKTSAYVPSSTIGTQLTLPIITLPVVKEVSSISNPTGGIQNICVVPQSHQIVANPAASIVLPVGLQSRAGVASLPQILITHELNPASSIAPCSRPPPVHVTDSSIKNPHMQGEDSQVSATPQSKCSSGSDNQNRSGDSRSMPSLGSLHCVQKMSSMGLCPQPEPAASSKRMLSPANSLDIAMEKQQKRAKDEHGAACLTDGRSLSYLNSKMAEVTRQRKLMLVRQVCTTEPVDSPIDLEPPQQHPGKTDVGSSDTVDTLTLDNCKNRVNAPTGQTAESKPAAVENYPEPSGPASAPVPPNCTLKSLGKCEEGRSPSKSPVRTLSLHAQGKLTASVSVVNTRDSHRLSFPSLKTATTLTWCYLMKRKSLHIPQTDQKISAYSTWSIPQKNPNPLGLPTKVVMSLFNSKQIAKKTHYTQAITTSLKSDILSYSSKLKDSLPKVITPQTCKPNDKCKLKPETQQSNESDRDSSSSKSEPRRVKIFDGGYKSNEEYVYVRGRGRGKYICEECGIRCKKPSMLRKHIRTHSDVRPYHCTHCNFSFKTKGNLTKHMKSKAHSKKCIEMGVSLSSVDDQDLDDAGERSQTGSTDRPGSDGEDSDGVEDEDNDGEDEDEEDSQAESGLSATPSVSASPQHLPAVPLDALPSALLAQMSISAASPGSAPLSLPPPPCSDSQASDTESVTMMSPVSVVSPSPAYLSFPTFPISMVSAPLSFPLPTTADAHSSDTESVTMMSPVSPCRQMSIDYPDVDSPTTPPAPGKGPKDTLTSPPPQHTSEAGFPVDRSTQTTLLPPMAYDPPGSLRFLPQTQIQDPGAGGAPTHLFSHLPLHSQQPFRSPYGMVPVGGIQLVPAGLAAYSTFLPVQAGPMQLTIPAVSVLHRSGSPIPAAPSPPRADGPLHPELLPCFPLGQMGLGGGQALQPLGLEALGVVGVANAGLPSAQLLPQPGLALKTLGLQVLTAGPGPQGVPSPQTHVPGLQILNIALPTLIPSLSPLPAAPVAPAAPPCAAETPVSCPSAAPATATPPRPAPSAAPRPQPAPAVQVSQEAMSYSPPPVGVALGPSAGGVEREEVTSSPGRSGPAGGARGLEAQKRLPFTRRQVTVDYNDASSDDEDRLVIAT
ncbi:zinc finger protein 40 [Conger conger]|uniref:zinc finger protein 40 n=1 Tax=Conger conger TaxID=82655 RepID=UPI002A5A4F83|nr:zinc finger protein 40 [Conger conger]